MRAKKALVRKFIFFKLPINVDQLLKLAFKLAYIKFFEKFTNKALMIEARTKVPSPDKIKF